MRSAADDAAVIESSWREPERFAVLFDRHAPHIYRYLARRAGPQVADDLVAETFQPAGPLRPPAPATVRTAVKFMHAGAVGTAAYLIIALAFIGDIRAYHLTVLGHHLTTAQLSHQRPLIITLVIAAGLVMIALWLWMARAAGQGRNWARILSTVLFGLATLGLTGNHGVAQVFCAVLTWLTGLAAVWLLWRPVSSAFFKPQALNRNGAAPAGGADRRP
jgi:hypothetical protein